MAECRYWLGDIRVRRAPVPRDLDAPAEPDVFVAERPAAAGIAVPGMPLGSPGMEQGEVRQPYTTVLFRRDGGREPFAQH